MATLRLKNFKTIFIVALAATATLWAASIAHAQPFFDDFEDGSATDGSPVTWADYPAPYNLGTFEVVNGDLVISPATTGPVLPAAPNYREKDVVAANRLFHDVNVLARVRALTNQPSVVGIGLLDTHFTNGNVGVSVNSSLVFDGSRRYLTMNREINQSFVNLGEVNTPVSHSAQDVNLRFSIRGNQASFSVWPDGQPEPLVPQMLRTLPSSFDNVQGRVVIWAGNAVTASPVAFRFVNVVPEPATAPLAVVSLLATLCWTRRRRLMGEEAVTAYCRRT
jgi:hypothetical protein